MTINIAFACIAIGTFLYSVWLGSNLQRIIDRQNDTIQRLIAREPVTYKETGQAPQKPSKEIYAAWGNQMVDLDKDT